MKVDYNSEIMMKKEIFGVGILLASGFGFAGQFTASGQIGYTNFSSSSNEYDYRYELKLKGDYKADNGLEIKFGDTYQYWKFNNWLKELGAKGHIGVNIPFVKIGKQFNKVFYGEIGGFYVKADTDKLLADGSFDINLTFEGKVNSNITLGLFNSYYRIANGDRSANADIVQISPYALINYGRFFGRVFISGQNIRATLGDETIGKFYARGGVDVGYRIIPQKVGIIAGGQIGKGWYWINPNGEDIYPMARPQMGNAYIGGYFKPFNNKNLVLTAKVNYEVWKTIDKNKEALDNQSGIGLSLGLTYAF